MLEPGRRGALQALLFRQAFWHRDLSKFVSGRPRTLPGWWPQGDIGVVLWSISAVGADCQNAGTLTALSTVPDDTMPTARSTVSARPSSSGSRRRSWPPSAARGPMLAERAIWRSAVGGLEACFVTCIGRGGKGINMPTPIGGPEPAPLAPRRRRVCQRGRVAKPSGTARPHRAMPSSALLHDIGVCHSTGSGSLPVGRQRR